MIVRLAGFVARSLFAVGLTFALLAVAALYGCYRLLRFTVAGSPPAPRREAAFAALAAVVTLAHALRPAGMPDGWLDEWEGETDAETGMAAAAADPLAAADR